MAALVITDLTGRKPHREIFPIIYVDKDDQVREMKKLFQLIREIDLSHVHSCMEDTDVESESSDEDSECEECGRSCKCRSSKPLKKKWTTAERNARVDELLLETNPVTSEDWYSLLERCVAYEILEDKYEYIWGVMLQAGEQQT